jgi:Tfp pilus assembly protein PilV
MTSGRAKRGGFSLVEVCLAVLVVGLGILSIFSLFPTGLAASESASADTEAGLFAEEVLSGLQASASEATWTKWKANDFYVPNIKIGVADLNADINDKIKIAYVLEVANGGGRVERIKEVILYAMPWRDVNPPPTADIKSRGSKFYTELFYTELPW